MRIKSTLVVSAMVFGLAILSACGSNDSDASDASAPSTTDSSTTAAGAVTDIPTSIAATTTAAAAADYSPIPVNPASSKAAKGLDFGTLTKVTTAGGVVTLHVDRAHFYVGAEAKAHNKGKAPLDDFLFQDTDGNKQYTFTLDPKASIQAEGNLQDNLENTQERVNLTPAKLIKNMTKLNAQNAKSDPDAVIPVYVWLRHTAGSDGPVTALADQFVS
jgi:hypothetical protein